MTSFGFGGNRAGGNSSSSTSNLSASAPPFTVDRSNSNPNSNPLVYYPESPYGLEPPFSHTWKYANSSSQKPELDIHSTRTTSFPLSDDYRISAAMSKSPSPTHWMAFSHDDKTSGNSLAYGGGVKSYYPPSVPPMVDKSSPLVEDISAYTHSVLDQDYRPEWMHRLEFINGQQSNRVEIDGKFSSGMEKVGDVSAQIDYTHFAIDRDYMPQHMNSLDISGMQYRGVELDGSCSSDMANVGGISTQFDYTQSAYDREYMSEQMDSLKINGNLYKRVELDGNVSSERAEICGSQIYINPVLEGCGIEFGDKSEEIYGRFNGVTDRAAHTGVLTVECMDDMDDKLFFDKNPRFLVSGSTHPESRSLSLSHEMNKNFYNYQNSWSPYEKRVRPDDSAFGSSISVTRSSPTVIVMPPPAIPDMIGQHNDSRIPTQNDNIAGVCSVHFDRSNLSNQKDPGPKPSSKIKNGSLDPKFSKQCNEKGVSSSSMVKEHSSSLHINDTFDGKIRERYGSQISDSNFPRGLAMGDDSVQAVNSVEDSSDFIDHHNLAVDSPCWKGTPSSQFSIFDVEAGSLHSFIGNSNENYGLDEAKHKDFRLVDDPTRSFSTEACQNDKNDENESVKNNIFPSESILDANRPTKELILLDNAKAQNFMVSTLRSSNGVQIGALQMLRTDSDFPENLNCGSHTKTSDSKHLCNKLEDVMNLNDASESSGAVAFHVAEKVLASPSSQEDATEHVKLQSDSKTRTMIKTIHYLSEMLLSDLSHDACTLEEQDNLALKNTISNLDAYMSIKIARPRNKQEPSNLMGYISEKFGEYHDKGNVDYKHGHEQDGERADKSPVFSILRDDSDITKDDGVAKAIKKVLEENFLYDEEMDSQAILFKSLWLEAEAALCSVSYKARFDRLKIEMEQANPKSSKENKDVAETMQKDHISPVASTSSKLTIKSQHSMIPKPTTQKSSVSVQDLDDKNDSIMSRFNILKSREDHLDSIDMKNEQRSKTVVVEQLEGEALNKPTQSSDFVYQAMPLNEAKNIGLSIAGHGYEPGQSCTNTRITRQSNQRGCGYRDSLSLSWEELRDGFGWEDSGKK